jgi:hypothetical protein
MQNLIDTLLIFNKLSIEMANRTLAMLKAEAYDINKAKSLGQDMAVLTSLMNMNIIDACSYLDEYHKHFGVTTEFEYKTKISEIKTVCKPLVSQINQWKDLRLVRNSFVAHNLRTKDNTMIFRTQLNYNAPRGPYEIELLNDIIQLISHIIIEKEFQTEMEYAKNNFKLNIPTFKGFSKNNCWTIMDSLIERTNQNLKKHNKQYFINL